MKAVTQLLNYLATHPDAILRYRASDMILWTHTDGSYLSESKSRSRVGGYHFLSNMPKNNPPLPDDEPPMNNGAIQVVASILKEILASAFETEVAAMFYNCREAVPIRITLEEMGHPQPPTPVETDNVTAAGFANDTLKQKRSKAIDMRFYWIRDRVRQKQFNIYWRRGSEGNKADYFTKHHPPTHHQAVRPLYLHEEAATNNYYDCLVDDSDDETVVISNRSRSSGEGV